MGKRGRIATDDQEVLQGLVDGVVEVGKNCVRTIKGDNRTDVYEYDFEKTIIKYQKDPLLPPTVNGGWRMVSSDTIVKKEPQYVEDSTPEKFGEPEDNASLPKTKRKYLNPANNKWVGYTRAVNLGLV